MIALWVATLLTAAPNFLYYVNGYAQFGMRHALDFEPFLVALMLLAARERIAVVGARAHRLLVRGRAVGLLVLAEFVRTP